MQYTADTDIKCTKTKLDGNTIFNLARKIFQKNSKAKGTKQPQKLTFGQVWQTKSDKIPLSATRKVVIIDCWQNLSAEDPIVRVAPVYEPIFDGAYRVEHVATELDLVLSARSRPIGDAIIEVWNSQPMLRKNLFHCFGELSTINKRLLEKLVKCCWGAEVDIEYRALGDLRTEGSEEKELFQMKEWHAAKYLSSEVNDIFLT